MSEWGLLPHLLELGGRSLALGWLLPQLCGVRRGRENVDL